jgi:hypothetical protein
MSKNKIALKPFLESISNYCNELSKSELTTLILELAKGVGTSHRTVLLKQVKAALPGNQLIETTAATPIDEFLNAVEALKESIEERIESIDDGSYWDHGGGWDEDYYDEEPNYVDEEQVDELAAFFYEAEDLFIDEHFAEARQAYERLFDLLDYVDEFSSVNLGENMDRREARARYCRSVYETESPEKRLKRFAQAMLVDLSSEDFPGPADIDLPLLRDVMDAVAADMADVDTFLPAWRSLLDGKYKTKRAADLLLEVEYQLKGMEGIARLARKWKKSQPKGYLFWLAKINEEGNDEKIDRIGKEALAALPPGDEREQVAEYMQTAAQRLGNDGCLLFATRERLFSKFNDQNLLDFVNRVPNLNDRFDELGKVRGKIESNLQIKKEEQALYTKVLLMQGELDQALKMEKGSKAVGWSYGNNTGMVFSSVLSVTADRHSNATAIGELLRMYANRTSIYSNRISVEDKGSVSFAEAIVQGLAAVKFSVTKKAKYFKWAKEIGTARIEHIVSNQHRRAYDRAALVLGALAEAYAAREKTRQAKEILQHYYNEKFKRYRAFRSEVNAVVSRSLLLKKLKCI